jgi:Rrf2 family protein
MQFTKAEEYGLFGMIHLAKLQRGAIASLGEIADSQDIPEKFLAKIFQNLSRAELLHVYRGVRGGFSLAKPPRRISIADILNAIQDDSEAVKCAINGKDCPKRRNCPVRDLILEGRRRMFTYYKKCSLYDLAEKYS